MADARKMLRAQSRRNDQKSRGELQRRDVKNRELNFTNENTGTV
jgi:hypothetical protein